MDCVGKVSFVKDKVLFSGDITFLEVPYFIFLLHQHLNGKWELLQEFQQVSWS